MVLKATIETLQTQLLVKDKQLEELTATVKAQAQSINADRHSELAEKLQGHNFITDGAERIPRMARLKQFFKGE
ncbi:hypothetical protein [Aminipila sp.]|uniref:hypothetical protein n=1 Tax=Aminipila sp. TaxID=2060095 RepID=UPI002896CA8B|nr:hypothetical protein [Aminipila sp.]